MNNKEHFLKAAYYGHVDKIKKLLSDPDFDPSYWSNEPLRYASEFGKIEIVKLLLQDSRVNPNDSHNYAIRYASRNGHLEIVKLLLQDSRVDLSYCTDDVIRSILCSDKTNNIEIIKLLMSSPKFPTVVNSPIIICSPLGYELSSLQGVNSDNPTTNKKLTVYLAATRNSEISKLIFPKYFPHIHEYFLNKSIRTLQLKFLQRIYRPEHGFVKKIADQFD